jgi:zinc protease
MSFAFRHRAARSLTAAAFVLLALISCVARAALPPGVTQGASVEGVTEYTLANGLRVLLFPDATKPTTTVNVTYLVGSRQENYGETGWRTCSSICCSRHAHDREHFPGARQRGLRFNGSTFFDRTNYFETFTASEENLDWALAMEADRMVNSFVAKKDLDTEMTVVRNEYESGENSPQRVLWGRMQSAAYQWHTTATSRSARARTSRTSTSLGCRRSTASTISRTTRC